MISYSMRYVASERFSLFPLISHVFLPAFSTHFSQVAIVKVPSFSREEGIGWHRKFDVFILVLAKCASSTRFRLNWMAKTYYSKRGSTRQTDGHNVSINLAKKGRGRKANKKRLVCVDSIDTLFKLPFVFVLKIMF